MKTLAVLILSALTLGAYNYVPTRSALETRDRPRPAQEEMELREQRADFANSTDRRPGALDPESVPLNQRHDSVEDKKRGELIPYGIK